MIDALFGSKTRVKLLHLFLSNPGKSFYVREITRLIDEQINSVRRELANMLEVGVITSDSKNNKLYYEVDQRYEHYLAFRAIFANEKPKSLLALEQTESWQELIGKIPSLKLAVASGVLVPGSQSNIDLLFAGNLSSSKVKSTVSEIEKIEGRELNYTTLSYDEFYYRLNVRDKFISGILGDKHVVVVDKEGILKAADKE